MRTFLATTLSAACLLLALGRTARAGPGSDPRGPSPAPAAPPPTWRWQAVPVYEDVEVPVTERRKKPLVRIRFVPRYEVIVEPVYGERRVPVVKRVVDPATGAARDVVVGERTVRVVAHERRRRHLVRYDPVEVPIGCTWETVTTGTRKVHVLKGWRWARVLVADTPTGSPAAATLDDGAAATR